jgi:UDP-GlcNAc:undecaprenyl-phosphate GlcNAc-1-phosphate transferase
MIALIGFVVAAAISLALTPAIGRLGTRLGMLDMPTARKIHSAPTPRSGGLALVISFFGTILILGLFIPQFIPDNYPLAARRSLTFTGCAVLMFLLGFADDKWRLGPWLKLFVQFAIINISILGNVKIDYLTVGQFLHIGSPVGSYILTVGWYLLLINAINLIDGIDGLAAGISFFACGLIAFLCWWRLSPVGVVPFAIFAGALLGFLRYNFNPASIFLGDGGSYFIGYVIAGLSTINSVKSQTSLAILIPLLALGVPVFDTLVTPFRRFVLGRKIYQPDKDHFHHKMLQKGWSQRRVAIILYSCSIILALVSLVLINLRDTQVGIVLLLLAAAFFVFVVKINYLEYFAIDKILGWVHDIIDSSCLAHTRRSFLDIQLKLLDAPCIYSAWEILGIALHKLGFDYAHLSIPSEALPARPPDSFLVESDAYSLSIEEAPDKSVTRLFWENGAAPSTKAMQCPLNSTMRIELPLFLPSKNVAAQLVLVKDLGSGTIERYTLRRVEQLHRTLSHFIADLDKNRREGPESKGS